MATRTHWARLATLLRWQNISLCALLISRPMYNWPIHEKLTPRSTQNPHGLIWTKILNRSGQYRQCAGRSSLPVAQANSHSLTHLLTQQSSTTTERPATVRSCTWFIIDIAAPPYSFSFTAFLINRHLDRWRERS